MMKFSADETLLLNRIQHSVPMTPRPFQDLGDDLGFSERTVLDTLETLKQAGVIRNIAAIFNPQSLGYTLGLDG